MKHFLIVAIAATAIISCSQSKKAKEWPAEVQKEFTESCIENARNGIGEEKAIIYCDCALEKTMKKFPDPKDADNITMGETIELATECSKDPRMNIQTPKADSTAAQSSNEGQ